MLPSGGSSLPERMDPQVREPPIRALRAVIRNASLFAALGAASGLCGCFTTLETAKTVDGASLTAGVARYTTEETRCDGSDCREVDEPHGFLVIMPRFGVAATDSTFGFDFGLRFLTDRFDHPYTRDAGWLWTVEPKLQIPRNHIADVAFGVDFLGLYPKDLSLFVSRDVTPAVSPYGRLTFLWAFWNLVHGELADTEGAAKRLTLGLALTLERWLCVYVEGERYFGDLGDGNPEVRPAVGIELRPSFRARPATTSTGEASPSG